jgi:hypothetical protein
MPVLLRFVRTSEHGMNVACTLLEHIACMVQLCTRPLLQFCVRPLLSFADSFKHSQRIETR